MAARTGTPTKRQQEQTRAAIQTTQLIKRLQNFALEQGEVEIDPQRLKAIEILLRKSLPDLQSVQLSGAGENGEHLHKIERVIVKATDPDT